VARTASRDAGAGVPRVSDSLEPGPACTPVSRLLVLPSMIIDSSPSPSPFPCVRMCVNVRPRALVRVCMFAFLHVCVGVCVCVCIVRSCLCLRFFMFCVCVCVYVHLNTPVPRLFVLLSFSFYEFLSCLAAGSSDRFFPPFLVGSCVSVCVCGVRFVCSARVCSCLAVGSSDRRVV